ncbi:thioester reductase domain-containing protein [Burkholderia ubonensis]|uniref:thioester reductase domain-containing protein n=1 Tax=Burkholderia ubonensis TaxID=101571 RepID=UPI000A549E22|nr:thioester reductase domain-containing protein [Burkholderia ubonensis]
MNNDLRYPHSTHDADSPLASKIAQDLYLLPGTTMSRRGPGGPRPPALRRILLTGATGFVGIHLLDELLRRTTAIVHCLVRAENWVDGLKRLATAMQRYGLDSQHLVSRVVIEVGDLAEPHCGLRPSRWEALAAELDAVLHNGALVNFVLPYHELRAPNVVATRWLLHLAAAAGCRFLYVSTTMAVTAAGGTTQLGRDRIFEEDPPPSVSFLGAGYGQSKWAAERLVELATAAGLPTAILRVGMVIGDTRSGRRPQEQIQARFVAASVAAGILPALPRPIDLVPVEYISSATIALLTSAHPPSGNYHLANPQPVTEKVWQAAVQRLDLKLRILPFDDWLAAMREAARRTPDHPLSALVRGAKLGTGLQEFQQGLPVYDCSRTVSALAGTGVICPPPDDTLIARLLQTTQ